MKVPCLPHEAAGVLRPRIGEALRQLAADGPVRLSVRGECMSPLLTGGQQVKIAAARFYWPGDVVAFLSTTGGLVVHRVIGYRLGPGRLRFQTRADASGTLDPPLAPDRVVGRVLEVDVTAVDRIRALARFLRLWLRGLLPR